MGSSFDNSTDCSLPTLEMRSNQSESSSKCPPLKTSYGGVRIVDDFGGSENGTPRQSPRQLSRSPLASKSNDVDGNAIEALPRFVATNPLVPARPAPRASHFGSYADAAAAGVSHFKTDGSCGSKDSGALTQLNALVCLHAFDLGYE